MDEFELRLTQRQAELTTAALDAHSRLYLGQLEIVLLEHPAIAQRLNSENRAEAEFLVSSLKKLLFGFERNQSYGIHNSSFVDDAARQEYDVMKVIKHRLLWDRHETGRSAIPFGPYADEPQRASTDWSIPLPVMTRVPVDKKVL